MMTTHENSLADVLSNIPQHPFIKSTIRSQKKNRCNILMVDDDYEYVMVLSKFLSSPEVNIEFETDWWEAVNKYPLSKFDLIVSDINMPRYNGRDAFEYVSQYLKGVRMIFMTALDDEGIKSFLPERILKLYPVLSKSKGLSHVRSRIQFELNHVMEEKRGKIARTPKEKDNKKKGFLN